MSKRRHQGSQKKLRTVTFVVRVELMLKPLVGTQYMCINDREHKLVIRSAVHAQVLEKMGDRSVAYFRAAYNQRTTQFSLKTPVPDEEWQ